MPIRDYYDDKGQSYRAINIHVPVEVWQLIKDQKHARQTTYSEVIIHAVLATYRDPETGRDKHGKDHQNR